MIKVCLVCQKQQEDIHVGDLSPYNISHCICSANCSIIHDLWMNNEYLQNHYSLKEYYIYMMADKSKQTKERG